MSTADQRRADEQRIARWVREHARAVRGYVFGLVRRADVADDIVQQVFQRAWQARERYRDESRERGYLLRIADRLVVDRSRRLGYEQNVDAATWRDLEPQSRDGAPLDELARSEACDELAEALDQLATAQKRVLLLRYFGDLTFEEIAAQLDCPLGTALSHARRGLTTLRKLLPSETNVEQAVLSAKI